MVKILPLLIFLSYPINAISSNEADVKKNHLEDIFIWKMSDELKLTAQEEKQFTEINKLLNRKKSEINKKIQTSIQQLNDTNSTVYLKKHKKLIQEYNDISVSEFELIKKLLGVKKFISYLKIKNELTTKFKSILIGDRGNDKEEQKTKALPPPKVIVESK